MKKVIFRVIPQEEYWDTINDEIEELEEESKLSKGKLQDAETVTFDTSEDLLKFLSGTTLKILEALGQAKPQSITELSNLLKKDKSLISKKVKELEVYGLVTSTTSESPGKIPAKMVQAVYDKIIIEIETGKHKEAV